MKYKKGNRVNCKFGQGYIINEKESNKNSKSKSKETHEFKGDELINVTADLTDDKSVSSNKDDFRNNNSFPDDLNDFTYDLMEGIVGEKNMTFERYMDTPKNSRESNFNIGEKGSHSKNKTKKNKKNNLVL